MKKGDAITSTLILCLAGALAETTHWEKRTALPIKVSDQSATTVNNLIYIIGGCIGDQVGYTCPAITGKIQLFSPRLNSFTTELPDAPRPRYRHSAVAVGSKIFVIGGRDLADNTISEVDVFETADHTWSTLQWQWTDAKSDNDAMVIDGLIYIVGGYSADYSTTFATTDILDPAAGWTLANSHVTIAPMIQERGDFAIVEATNSSSQSKFFAFGGWSSEDNFASTHTTTEVYDVDTNTWTLLSADVGDLIIGRADKASGWLDGRVFAVGGETLSTGGGYAVVEDVEAADAAALSDAAVAESSGSEAQEDGLWKAVYEVPENKFRFAAATATIEGGEAIFVFGGQAPEQWCPASNASCNIITNHTWAFFYWEAPTSEPTPMPTPLPTPKPEQKSSSSSVLSAGIILGIVAGLVAAAICAAVVVKYTPTRESIDTTSTKAEKLSTIEIGDNSADGKNNNPLI